MTEEEYNNAIEENDRKWISEMDRIQQEFVLSNKKHEKGDVITENGITFIVDEIKCGFKSLFGGPCCAYYGRILKKDGTFRKDGKTYKCTI